MGFLPAQGFAPDRASCLSAAELSVGVGICRPQLSSHCCSPLVKSSGARSEELGVQGKANAAEYVVPWWPYGKRVLADEQGGRQGATLPGARQPLRQVVTLGRCQHRCCSRGVFGYLGCVGRKSLFPECANPGQPAIWSALKITLGELCSHTLLGRGIYY